MHNCVAPDDVRHFTGSVLMIHRRIPHCFLILLFCGLTCPLLSENNSNVLSDRIPYPIALVKLSILDDNTAVRISHTGSEDYVVIAELNDISVKNSRTKIDKFTYRESLEKAYYLSNFEAQQLQIVNKSLISTLETFEKHLQTGKWGHCLYLDAFLPKFLRGYYLLIGVARNNTRRYLKATRIFDGKYDVSLNSPLSDERLADWRKSPDGIVKLRIATKELIYQLRQWEKRELTDINRNPEIPLSAKCEEALDLFVRIYFGIHAPPQTTLP
jgi:hypothetical protein